MCDTCNFVVPHLSVVLLFVEVVSGKKQFFLCVRTYKRTLFSSKVVAAVPMQILISMSWLSIDCGGKGSVWL